MKIMIDGMFFDGTIDREVGGKGIIKIYGSREDFELFGDLFRNRTVVPVSRKDWSAPVVFLSVVYIDNRVNYLIEMRYQVHY